VAVGDVLFLIRRAAAAPVGYQAGRGRRRRSVLDTPSAAAPVGYQAGRGRRWRSVLDTPSAAARRR